MFMGMVIYPAVDKECFKHIQSVRGQESRRDEVFTMLSYEVCTTIDAINMDDLIRSGYTVLIRENTPR